MSLPVSAFTDSELAVLVQDEASSLWRAHKPLEIYASAIAGVLTGLVVGAGTYLFGASTGFPYGAVIVGVFTAILTAILTALIIYGYFRFILAPSNLYFKTHRALEETQRLLREEQARLGDAQISAEILDSSFKEKRHPNNIWEFDGLYFNARIQFVNNTPPLTTITNFFAQVEVGGKNIFSDWAAEGPTLDEQPDWTWEIDEKSPTSELIRVPCNGGRTFDNLYRPPVKAEFTVAQNGWLQFYFKDIDLRHLFNGRIRVVMIDHKKRQHFTDWQLIEPA
jgi:hypothetical protein